MRTAQYSGINVKKVIIRTMVVSGLLCGVATLPAGCFAGGLVLGVPMGPLMMNLLPLLLLSALIAAGLGKTVYTPKAFYKFYRVLAKVMPTKLMMQFAKT